MLEASQLVGGPIYNRLDTMIVIESFAVDEEFRRHGIGKQLVELALLELDQTRRFAGLS